MGKSDKTGKWRSSVKSLKLALEFSFIIVIPLIVLVPLGKWLQAKYSSEMYLVLCMFAALTCSSVWMYIKIKDIYKDFINKD